MNIENYTLTNNVYKVNNSEIKNEFEEKYIELRKKENRLYSDDELKYLPMIAANHKHYKEWVLRKQSANRLINYITKKNKPLHILEVGCGNGWLSNSLSRIQNTFVVGLDINFTELQQAARVFKKENLIFIYDVLSQKLLSAIHFDIVVFAASAQYFSSIKSVIKMVLPMLNKDGEIHILDTNFYTAVEVNNAKKRSQAYYTSLGFPEFSANYHHHSLHELNGFNVDKLYEPSSIKSIFTKHKNPFVWIRIKALK